MADPTPLGNGQCRCGKVRLHISAPALMTAACHCIGCQRMTGSAFSLTAFVPSGGFEVTQGSPVIGGLNGDAQNHYHCPDCMSWIFTRMAGFDAFINLRSTMLDDPIPDAPFIETFTSEKLPWATTSAQHSFEKFPQQEDFPTLMTVFADQARQENHYG